MGAMKSNNTAVALAIQAAAGTFTTPSQPTDLMPVSQFRWNITSVNLANDEYTGAPIKNAAQVAGKRVAWSYNVKLRPPGGATIPAANAFLLGRILQAAKYTELRTTTAIPAAAEAGTAGTTNSLTLGAGATGTADLYKGMAIQLNGQGTTLKDELTAIRSYTAAKGRDVHRDVRGDRHRQLSDPGPARLHARCFVERPDHPLAAGVG
jgi:hypothetical protein